MSTSWLSSTKEEFNWQDEIVWQAPLGVGLYGGDSHTHRTPGYSVPLLPTPLQSHCIVKHSCPQFASHYSRPSILHTQSSVVWGENNLICVTEFALCEALWREIISIMLFILVGPEAKCIETSRPLPLNVYKATRPTASASPLDPSRSSRNTHRHLRNFAQSDDCWLFISFSADPLPHSLTL